MEHVVCVILTAEYGSDHGEHLDDVGRGGTQWQG